jgi:hypothetical protein
MTTDARSATAAMMSGALREDLEDEDGLRRLELNFHLA